MTAYVKYEKVKEYIEAEDLLDHFVQWLSDDELEEILDDAIRDSDLDYFFSEEF